MREVGEEEEEEEKKKNKKESAPSNGVTTRVWISKPWTEAPKYTYGR